MTIRRVNKNLSIWVKDLGKKNIRVIDNVKKSYELVRVRFALTEHIIFLRNYQFQQRIKSSVISILNTSSN